MSGDLYEIECLLWFISGVLITICFLLGLISGKMK